MYIIVAGTITGNDGFAAMMANLSVEFFETLKHTVADTVEPNEILESKIAALVKFQLSVIALGVNNEREFVSFESNQNDLALIDVSMLVPPGNIGLIFAVAYGYLIEVVVSHIRISFLYASVARFFAVFFGQSSEKSR